MDVQEKVEVFIWSVLFQESELENIAYTFGFLNWRMAKTHDAKRVEFNSQSKKVKG
jgi:hypothetical protein